MYSYYHCNRPSRIHTAAMADYSSYSLGRFSGLNFAHLMAAGTEALADGMVATYKAHVSYQFPPEKEDDRLHPAAQRFSLPTLQQKEETEDLWPSLNLSVSSSILSPSCLQQSPNDDTLLSPNGPSFAHLSLDGSSFGDSPARQRNEAASSWSLQGYLAAEPMFHKQSLATVGFNLPCDLQICERIGQGSYGAVFEGETNHPNSCCMVYTGDAPTPPCLPKLI